MLLSMWTSILVELKPVDAIRALADLGWPALEFSTEHLVNVEQADDPEAAANEVREVVEELGLFMSQAHLLLGGNVAAADDEVRERDLATFERHIDLCARMGVEVGVIHPGGDRPATLEEERAERARRIEGFSRLAGFAAERGFALAVENMCDRERAARGALGQRTYGSTIPELHELIDAVGAPNMGICLDVGHGNVQGLDMAESIRQCGRRLIATHIQDNDGTRDQHLAPPRGTIDWKAGIGALRDLDYEGIFNLEVPGERGLPPELMLPRIAAIHATTTWLLKCEEEGNP
ncbi:MAG: sugar phosphate isomerase/epimerase [candidate division WS1 bacterium]|jgi:sugar phosphate isomerase/epimerase|nr:sugar phosphate isomerase/epimerase [candidate division WS1 bacterium]